MKTNFNLREKNSTGETLILLIIRWDNCKLKYSTKESINPKFWETEKEKKNFQRIKITKEFPEHPEFNARLDYIEATAKNIFRKYLNDNDNKSPRAEELKNLLDLSLRKKQNKPKMDMLGFIEKLIGDAKHRFNTKTGKQLAKGTIVIYQNVFNILKQYSIQNSKKIDFDIIDLNFYHDYTEYLSKDLNFANNTVGRHIKTIKSWMNESSERGLHTNFSFKNKNWKVISEPCDSIYLNEVELDELANLDLSNNVRLERVRDLFIVSCYTGLRYSDFSALKSNNFKGNFIEIQTQKTGQKVVIPIHKTIQLIMEKYKGKFSNSLPPAISNAKTNKFLKEIGKMLKCLHLDVETKRTKGGVLVISNFKKWELLTCHSGRRSFATNLHKAGLSSIVIMAITGHKTEKAFMKYIKTTPTENSNLLLQHWLKLEEKANLIVEQNEKQIVEQK